MGELENWRAGVVPRDECYLSIYSSKDGAEIRQWAPDMLLVSTN
jgi:hypothetical protein